MAILNLGIFGGIALPKPTCIHEWKAVWDREALQCQKCALGITFALVKMLNKPLLAYWFIPDNLADAIKEAEESQRVPVEIGDKFRLKASKLVAKVVATGYRDGTDFAEVQLDNGVKTEISKDELRRNAEKL